MLRNGIDLHTISHLAWAPTWRKPNLHKLMTSAENQEYRNEKSDSIGEKTFSSLTESRKDGPGSSGSSVHNCRVERAHRDIYSGVLCFFARTFGHLEDNGLLDPLNELPLFALHYTFMPRINECLQEFKRQWENHPLSSEGNCSPLQLYTAGMLENEHSGYAAVASVFDPGSMHDYGFDPSGPFPMDEDYQVLVSPN